jgi:hypothetical protein
MRKIELSQGKFALVDDEDYRFLNNFSWKYLVATEYHPPRAATALNFESRNVAWVKMERFLLKEKKGYTIFHRNHNTLDNTKINLVLVKVSIIRHNATKPRTGITSRYKGVSFRINSGCKNGRWRAAITCNGKKVEKSFKIESEAALWYNKKAIEIFGEFAYQNKVD